MRTGCAIGLPQKVHVGPHSEQGVNLVSLAIAMLRTYYYSTQPIKTMAGHGQGIPTDRELS